MVNPDLLWLYHERSGSPEFWAEPLNALSNGAFLWAAACAHALAARRGVVTPSSTALVLLAASIGVGSFLFHTSVSPLTMWLDIGPIAAFQVAFLWLACREMLGLGVGASAGAVGVVLGASFALLPFHRPLNGSLFYVPTLVGLLGLATWWVERIRVEPFLLLGAAGCFAGALAARTLDWSTPWPQGSHFLWHALNGAVVYLALRARIVFWESAGLASIRGPGPEPSQRT